MTPRDRDRWMAGVLADQTLGDGDKCLGVRICLHRNLKTGQCNPSYDRLAAGTAKTIAAIPKQIKRLEHAGWLRRNSTRGRYSNSYELAFPGEATADRNT